MKISSYYYNVIRIKAFFLNGVLKLFVFSLFGFCLNQVLYAQGAQTMLVNVGTNINSIYEEMNPIVSPDGNTMYFCRGRHPENIGGRKDKGDIWFSVKDENGNWQKAQNLGHPVNNSFKNDLAGISADGNTLYLNYTYGQDGKSSNPGLSYTKRATSGWSAPVKLEIPYFYNASEHQSVFISNNEKIIIFSIESYGSYGGEDLYISFKQPSGAWSEPMNLGPTINSSNQEITPFLAKDNKTLFFVTNGKKGMGSKDIYKSQRLDSTWKNWSEPENLGPQVNTEGMEMYYFQDNESLFAYIVSTQNSDGYGDIHQIKIRQEDIPDEVIDENVFPTQLLVNEEFEDNMFQIPDTVIVFKIDQEILPQENEEETPLSNFNGKVINAQNKKAIMAFLTIENQHQIKKITNDEQNGDFKYYFDSPGKYKINVSSKGFMSREEYIEILHTDSVTDVVFNLMPLEIGTTIQLHDVLFERGTSRILENSFPELDKVATMMLENPNLFIELAGHTDNQGVAKLNIKLSQERVENVKKYLVQKDVEPFRISGKGYGGIKPIASNKNEDSRKLNRRVEFTIVKN